MVNDLVPIFLGITAGVHAACYGVYKDSPYESFILTRFVREIIIALVIGFSFVFLHIAESERYFVIFLVILALSRVITEFYKLFVRVENQNKYLIPSQIHFFKKIIQNRVLRLLMGLLFIIGIYGIFLVSSDLLISFTAQQKGMIIGLITGLGTAFGGGYKDAFFEGFDKIKFLRSPIMGTLGGLFVSLYTSTILFILLGAVGFERMFVELYKGFLKKGYSPGKFKSKKPMYPDLLNKKKNFTIPYVITWIIFAGLLFI